MLGHDGLDDECGESKDPMTPEQLLRLTLLKACQR